MAFSFFYRAARRVGEGLSGHHTGSVATGAGIMVLRHQISALRRQASRPRFS
ncbi:MAG TPA: hypothetical protein VFP54_04945 [Acidimicrobiales bacterium]|nr:hypothetical protein [Acidimicrobiales bacterium]